jgi:hypothetical protein
MNNTEIPKIRVDFQNADRNGNVRLNTIGTIEDLARYGVRLQPGLVMRLVAEELSAEGRALFSDEEKLWVAEVDWKEVIPPNDLV